MAQDPGPDPGAATTNEPIVGTPVPTPLNPEEEAPPTEEAVPPPPILAEAIRAEQKRQLQRLHREIRWWRPRATKQCQKIGLPLHWARTSPQVPRAKRQKWTAARAFWHCGTVAKQQEAQKWARLATKGRVKVRVLTGRGPVYESEDLATARKLAAGWRQKFVVKVRNMRWRAPEAALYAEWYYRLGDGKRPGALWRCAQGFRPGDGTGEGGLGRPLWNGGNVDYDPYDGGGSGSGAYAWLQMFYSTYLRMARAFLADTGLGGVIPRPERNWNHAFYQFMGAGWAFTHGRRGEWMASACR